MREKTFRFDRRSPLVVILIVAVGVVAYLLWATDWITIEGQHTIYAVTCDRGIWDGLYCNGRLAAADRYRFQASRSRNEVLFWTVGSSAPSGRHGDCTVLNRDNWSCTYVPEERSSLVLALSKGKPVPGAPGNAEFRAVAKWKWFALRAGAPWFQTADYGTIPAQISKMRK
jgi:hypothetical protein